MALEHKKFEQIRELLDEMYSAEDATRELIDRVGLTEDQLKVVNLLIVQALRYYDALKEGGKLTVR